MSIERNKTDRTALYPLWYNKLQLGNAYTENFTVFKSKCLKVTFLIMCQK